MALKRTKNCEIFKVFDHFDQLSPIIFLEYLGPIFLNTLLCIMNHTDTQKSCIRIYFVTIHIHQLRILYIALYMKQYITPWLFQSPF